MPVWPNGLRVKPKISSPYGYSAEYDGFHYGTDMYGFPYNCAVASGQVIHIGWNTFGGGGREVWYRIGNGDVIVYYHNDVDVFVVDQEWIPEGKPLGVQSNTGKARGSHLHVEVWLKGRRDSRTDPAAYFAALVGSSVAGGAGTLIVNYEKEKHMLIYQISGGGLIGTIWGLAPGAMFNAPDAASGILMAKDWNPNGELISRTESEVRTIAGLLGIPNNLIAAGMAGVNWSWSKDAATSKPAASGGATDLSPVLSKITEVSRQISDFPVAPTAVQVADEVRLKFKTEPLT